MNANLQYNKELSLILYTARLAHRNKMYSFNISEVGYHPVRVVLNHAFVGKDSL